MDDFAQKHPRGAGGRFIPAGTTSLGPATLAAHRFDEPDTDTLGMAREVAGLDLRQPAARSLLAACAGASSEDHEVVFRDRGGDELQTEVYGKGFYAKLAVRMAGDPQHPQRIVRLERLDNDVARSGRSGVEVLAGMVKALRQLPATHIFLTAAGSATHDTFNGYYSWPRMGFDGILSEEQFRRLPATFRKQMGRMRHLADLFALGGGEAWKSCGDDIVCYFDLAPTSRSSKALESYIASRRAAFARSTEGWEAYEGKRGKRKGQSGRRNPATKEVIWDDEQPAIERDAGAGADPSAIERTTSASAKALAIHGRVFSSAAFRDLLEKRQGYRETLAGLQQVTNATSGRTLVETEKALGHEPLVRRFTEARQALEHSESVFLNTMIGELIARNPHTIAVNSEVPALEGAQETPDQQTAGSVRVACEALSLLVEKLPGEEPLPPAPVWYRPVGASTLEGADGGYGRATGTLLLPRQGVTVDVVLHEMGHHLESWLPGASKACLDFYERRRGAEPIRSLAEINRAYAAYPKQMVGIQDRFEAVFQEEACYAGRYYPSEENPFKTSAELMMAVDGGLLVRGGPEMSAATELLSMGLQFLFFKPHRFEHDPEYFAFLVGILDGTLRRPS